jgi:hypothetical protein
MSRYTNSGSECVQLLSVITMGWLTQVSETAVHSLLRQIRQFHTERSNVDKQLVAYYSQVLMIFMESLRHTGDRNVYNKLRKRDTRKLLNRKLYV